MGTMMRRKTQGRALWSITSPIPRRSSRRLVPDYVEISIYRALLSPRHPSTGPG